ncbi:proteoglycan 3-like [Sorex araneus]|uniref:proteoglycan 3-like n=1 Tax=Sorex araneus TaxID=42254 RepID=UPI002433F4CB|nr:proteoglycan 3-like [Sorex araneus]
MKLLLLLLLLLGAVSARHLADNAPPPESLDTQADLSQDRDCSGEQKGELALHREEIPPREEEAEASDCQETFEDEDDLDSDPAASGDFEGPKEEDTVQLQGTPRRYVFVRTPQTFSRAQKTCRKRYRGHLVSIHNLRTNNELSCLANWVNQSQVWIGAIRRHWILGRKFKWTDRSNWNFARWAPGQPRRGKGRCVALSTQGGLWRRAPCKIKLPFICAA